MSGKTKGWLIAASSLVLVGCILFGGAMMTAKWDFLKLATTKYETTTYEISEEAKSVVVESITADITIRPAEDGKTRVISRVEENMPCQVAVKDGVLTVVQRDVRAWYEHIGIYFGRAEIILELPLGAYGDLAVKGSTADMQLAKGYTFQNVDIRLSTGDISFDGFSADGVTLTVSTGKIIGRNLLCSGDLGVNVSTGKAALEAVVCENFRSAGDTGDLTLRGLLVRQQLTIVRSTGDVLLEGCDAAELDIQTDTGDVEGSLLTEKTFLTETSTGDVNVPQTSAEGKCQIRTSTGDIEIELQN